MNATLDLLRSELAVGLDDKIATDLVSEFLTIRSDLSSKTIGRSAPGKFIETFVQALQFLERGKYDTDPDVEKYLKDLDSRTVKFGNGLRICGARLARAAYAIRSKRNIIHKGEVDPNMPDLSCLYSAAQWLLTELLREVTKKPIADAAKLVEFIQLPVSPLFEDFGSLRLVHNASTVEQEIFVLLGSRYPAYVTRKAVQESLARRSPRSVNRAILDLWNRKLLHEDKNGLILTSPGLSQARQIAHELTTGQWQSDNGGAYGISSVQPQISV